MSVFRRRRGEDETGGQPVESLDAGATDEDGANDEPEDGTPAGGRRAGPWDVSEVEDPGKGRVDLGGVWIPGREGLEVRVEADQNTGHVVAVTLVMADGALQLQPFAAPRTDGIWDEVRDEIRTGITAQGGTADEVDGPLGVELRTKVPVRDQEGRSGVQPARFLGVDGPRWFLRGVLTGRPAVEEGADEALLELFCDVVVVRGSEAMAPREPIALRLPGPAPGATSGDLEAGDQGSGDPLQPFRRGPEITEIR